MPHAMQLPFRYAAFSINIVDFNEQLPLKFRKEPVMDRICPDYSGFYCTNGNCPIALSDLYQECGMDVIRFCEDCPYYKGCEDCIFVADYESEGIHCHLGYFDS